MLSISLFPWLQSIQCTWADCSLNEEFVNSTFNFRRPIFSSSRTDSTSLKLPVLLVVAKLDFQHQEDLVDDFLSLFGALFTLILNIIWSLHNSLARVCKKRLLFILASLTFSLRTMKLLKPAIKLLKTQKRFFYCSYVAFMSLII